MSQPASHIPVAAPADLGRPLRLLVVEHNVADVELCLRELKTAGYEVQADVVAAPEEYAERLRRSDYDIILADYRLPHWTGLEAFEQLRQLGKDIPFLLVTGTLGEEVAVECIKQGVTDYVLKDRLARLAVAVRRALEEKALRDENAHAAQALRESEASFRLLFAHNPVPMWVFDLETLVFLQVNDAALAHYGYSRQEFLHMRLTDICPPEDVPRFLQELAAHPEPLWFSGPWRHCVKDGQIIDVEVTHHTLEFAGRPARVVVAHDITERLRAQRELEVRARQQTAVAELGQHALRGTALTALMEDAVRIMAQTLRVEYCKILELLPDGSALLLRAGVGWQEGLVGQATVGTGMDSQAGYTLASNGPVIVEDLRTDTRFSGPALLHEHGVVSGMSVIIPGPERPFGVLGAHTRSKWTFTPQDTDFLQAVANVLATASERKRAEDALLQSETRHRELVENATYGIYRVTVTGRFLEVNPALVQMLGYASKAELLSKCPQADIYCDPADREKLVEQGLRLGRVDGAEVQWKRKDGRLITVRLSGRTVFDEHTELQAFEVIAEDVTERRAMEKHLRQIQKFEAIGQLAGGIAHDFNNVMGAIMGWAELGQEQAPPESSLYSYFQKIRAQIERATGLTRQLLAFARRQLLEPRNLNLNHLVAELLTFLEKVISKDIEVRTVLSPELEAIRADPSQIEQVLMNLCLNARDAMPCGGRLVIETQNVELGEDYYRHHSYARPGRYVVLSVSDNGVGMDAATIEHIFEPFFTTKEMGKGTGLGLATVYGVVKQHGGFLHVYSEPAQGTVFRVYLPVAGVAPSEAELRERPDDEPVRGGSETILVAEDHDGVREMARMTLESLGYRLLLAANGAEALVLFLAQPDSIALVVLDVVMPKLAGPDAYLKMCETKPGLPVIFTSGYSAEMHSLSAVLQQGAAALQKPYGPSLLGRRVREILDHAARQASAARPASRDRR
ncbi:MAG: PAS domain S-box protein [Acidobacteria bacterium]|nr:PAS domain S-box protein [Acidobacteriota bacterium]